MSSPLHISKHYATLRFYTLNIINKNITGLTLKIYKNLKILIYK